MRREEIEELPPIYKELALMRSNKSPVVGSETAQFFSWSDSPEGFDFWEQVHAGKHPEIPVETQEELGQWLLNNKNSLSEVSMLPGGPMDSKPTNPKEVVGSQKVGLSCVPATVLLELGAAMQEGALKYGRYNWRESGARASVYFDATIRHLFAWWEGEDLDPDTNISHVTKAIASLTVLRDAMMSGVMTDDRVPSEVEHPVQDANMLVQGLRRVSERKEKPLSNNSFTCEPDNTTILPSHPYTGGEDMKAILESSKKPTSVASLNDAQIKARILEDSKK